MIFEYLQPVSENIQKYVESLSNQSLGKKVVMHTDTDYPNLENISLAIICANENRGADLENEDYDFDNFRRNFYSLFPGNWNKGIADLGDVLVGNQTSDTYFVLKTICAELIKLKIIPLVVGGSQDLTYALYRAFDNLDQMVNLVAIDNKFDFAKEEKLQSDSYLSRIIIEEPNNLYNFSSVGYQTYYTSQEEIDLIDKLFFDAYRLGEIIKNPAIVEPIFRDADIISLDLKAIRSADLGNETEFYPNGFDGREICSLARYAGISDKVSVFGIFNQFYSKNENHLIAQLLWYFIEGYHFRTYEYPFEEKTNYNKYIVLADDEELVFYKSNRSERWWIEINYNSIYNKTTKKTLLPCTHDDYLAACDAEIPERWWKAHKKSFY
ncbi:formimidoylglutamase [Flavobacterium urocaniciphilum]|uniref:Arginase family enzyme n=1 Tax=Flavobacterium urocaniciphilum TaxID=1299341 RepID=A0A1H9AS05_9FLAO|nr:formimidoylglutamase [Flavobacterium urocaniciphilum]SEP79315.1 Arginase family enzyme [Flavobacterium urocaniciphilum]